VVFDPATIADLATYADPLRPPEGITMVFVNGQLALAHGQLTGVRAGVVLRRGDA
jgi:N-acyl-D-amino-acid deacylase